MYYDSSMSDFLWPACWLKKQDFMRAAVGPWVSLAGFSLSEVIVVVEKQKRVSSAYLLGTPSNRDPTCTLLVAPHKDGRCAVPPC